VPGAVTAQLHDRDRKPAAATRDGASARRAIGRRAHDGHETRQPGEQFAFLETELAKARSLVEATSAIARFKVWTT
jgi:hypothetical protein